MAILRSPPRTLSGPPAHPNQELGGCSTGAAQAQHRRSTGAAQVQHRRSTGAAQAQHRHSIQGDSVPDHASR
eukprot:scaffold64_cov248-Pinguiococcus_pyrenoidosus.AAC.13